MNPTKAERLARLLATLTGMGFTYSEAQRLRRIEMTLSRWSEAECNGEIERDETTAKPVRVSRGYTQGNGPRVTWPIPDRETGALKQLATIVTRVNSCLPPRKRVVSYHQGDPRGASLYIVPVAALKTDRNQIVAKAESWGAVVSLAPFAAGAPCAYQVDKLPGLWATEEAAARAFLAHRKASIPARDVLPLDQYYTRGVAVCV